MRKKLTAAALAFIAAAFCCAALSGCEEQDNPATPDSATKDSAATTASSVAATAAPTEPETTTAPATEAPTESEEGEELDFAGEFDDFPVHFVSHGGDPEAQGQSDLYYHATLEFSSDGTMTGEFFTNLESTDEETIEQISNWTGAVRNGKVYKLGEHQYYFYIDNLEYENEPDTSEEVDGKTVKYVGGYGIDPDNNRMYIFTPGTGIEDMYSEDSKMDLDAFLKMMNKEPENGELGCYVLRGRVDDCYVSLTEEEAQMGPPPEQPQEPEQPQPPAQ